MNVKPFCQRSDRLGLAQAAGVLLVATGTGAFTYICWRAAHDPDTHYHSLWFAAALLGFIAHGNVCSLFISAVHEFAHGTVFKTRWLNAVFNRVYGLLNWTDSRDYFASHKAHHARTNHHDDAELHGSCRPLWIGTFLWSAVFNVPRFFGSLLKCRDWIWLSHASLTGIFLASGNWELIVLVQLAPFCFGWLELLVNYPQHAGMKLAADDLRETTRSLTLPSWLSFLHWHMEYHLEHHLHPAVPCYHLPELREALADDDPFFPDQQTLLSSWSFILRNRTPGRCGHGPNPMKAILRSCLPAFLIKNPGNQE